MKPKHRILVVEDKQHERLAIARLLWQEDYDVVLVTVAPVDDYDALIAAVDFAKVTKHEKARGEATVELPATITDVRSCRLLTGPRPNSHNTFDQPDEVRPVDLTSYRVAGGRASLTVPPYAIATIRLVCAT